MAYTEQDRVYVSHFLGFARMFIQADPRIENAITASQSVADGGTRPDSSTENFIKGCVYGFSASAGPPAIPARKGLLQVEADLDALDLQRGAIMADGETTLDSARESARLRAKGRRLVGGLARMLGMRGPRVDIFSSMPSVDSDPFWGDSSPYGPQGMG